MICSKPVALMLAGVVLLPALAAAQMRRTATSVEDRLIPYEVQEQDYGTWDAEIVWRDDVGRFLRSRGREVNAPGCGGRCIKTRVDGGLRRPASFGGMAEAGCAPAAGRDAICLSSGIPAGLHRAGHDLMGSPLPARITVERTSADRRTVAMYGTGPRNREFLLARVVYTRRR